MVESDYAIIIGSNEDFENLVIKASKPVFIQCWAAYFIKFYLKSWCGVCNTLKPQIKEYIQANYKDIITLAYLNVDEQEELADKLEVPFLI